jgi:coatomer subunit beta
MRWATQEHRHPYVRKNALLTIQTVYKHNEALMPDAPELVLNYMSNVQRTPRRRTHLGPSPS